MLDLLLLLMSPGYRRFPAFLAPGTDALWTVYLTLALSVFLCALDAFCRYTGIRIWRRLARNWQAFILYTQLESLLSVKHLANPMVPTGAWEARMVSGLLELGRKVECERIDFFLTHSRCAGRAVSLFCFWLHWLLRRGIDVFS